MQGSALVVDDNLLFQQTVRRGLANAGFPADGVATGAAAVQAASRQPPYKVIVLDYHLPDLDGLVVLQRLRAAGVRSPVIALTGEGNDEVASAFVRGGAVDYIDKKDYSGLRLGQTARAVTHVGDLEMSTQPGPDPVTARAPPSANVLVVDDNALARDVAKRYLESAGHRPAFATSGREAATKLAFGKFGAVLLDYNLPDIDGLEVLRHMRERGDTTPVIAVTGEGGDDVAAAFIKHGATDYITKSSLTAVRLSTTLRNVLWVGQLATTARSQAVRRALDSGGVRTN